MLHVCDKYTKILLFSKESGCELQELIYIEKQALEKCRLCQNMVLNRLLLLGTICAK